MDVRRGEGGPQARTPRLPVRCVENANGLRADQAPRGRLWALGCFFYVGWAALAEYVVVLSQHGKLLGVFRLK